MKFAVVLILFLIIILIVLLLKIVFNDRKYSPDDRIREAGDYGENKATATIKKVLGDEDFLFRNVEFSYENEKNELDCVIVNQYGVFIIEVKNYVGELVGNENDRVWKKYKYKRNGVYSKTVKNPIKQVKRQVYFLSKYLKSNGINVWIEGYVILINGNSPVNSKCILSDIDDVDKVIHTKDKKLLSNSTVEKIRALLG